MGASRSFHVAVFGIDGEVTAEGDWNLAQLSPEWLRFARGFLHANGEAFRKPIDTVRLSHIEFEFTSSRGTALGSFYSRGELITSTAYFAGSNPVGEVELQQMFVRSLRRIDLVRHAAASATPFAAVESIDARPLHVIVPWGLLSVPEDDHRVVSELANHLAGAFFYADERGAV